MNNLKDLTADQLLKLQADLSVQKESIRSQMKNISEELALRDAEVAMAKKLASMTPAERAALTKLTQAVAPSGIESSEAVKGF